MIIPSANQILIKLQKLISKNYINIDDEVFKTLVLSAKPNDITKTNKIKGSTKFPDFICTNGFIEHFDITSGKSNKKGYDIIKKEQLINKAHDNYIKNPIETYFETELLDRSDINNSIDNLHKSIKDHLEDHINSYNKYKNGNEHVSCFLISSDDLLKIRLYSSSNCSIEKLKELSKKLKDNNNYSMYYDKFLLDYLYTYKTKIDYIIYYNYNKDYFEILKIIDIPKILTNLYSDTNFIYDYSNQPIQYISEVTESFIYKLKGDE